MRSTSSDSAAASCTSGSFGCRSAASVSSSAASFRRPAFRSACALVVQTCEQQALDVGRIAAADADASGIGVDQLAAVFAGFIQAQQADEPERRRGRDRRDGGCGERQRTSATASSATTPKNTLRVRMPHSSCSTTAARAPGTRSTGPCAAVPDCTASSRQSCRRRAASSPPARRMPAVPTRETAGTRRRRRAARSRSGQIAGGNNPWPRAYNHAHETSISCCVFLGEPDGRHRLCRRRRGAAGCDADNGGLKLPQGFCAAVVADNVGAARHLVVAPNGDLFVSSRNGRGGTGGGVVALRDTDGDGKMDKREQFGDKGAPPASRCATATSTYATTNSILRYKLTPGELMPAAAPETDRRGPARSAVSTRTRGSRSTAEAASTSTSARRRMRASSRIVSRRSPARIRVRCSRSTAASGASTRTSRGRSRPTASATRPGCARWSGSRGTTTRCGP